MISLSVMGQFTTSIYMITFSKDVAGCILFYMHFSELMQMCIVFHANENNNHIFYYRLKGKVPSLHFTYKTLLLRNITEHFVSYHILKFIGLCMQFISYTSMRSERRRIPKGKNIFYSGKINYVISQFHIIIILS